MKIINRIDVAIIVCDFNGVDDYEKELIEKFDELKIPYLIVVNKSDVKKITLEGFENVLYTSVKNDENIVFEFKEALVKVLLFWLFRLIKKLPREELFCRRFKH